MQRIKNVRKAAIRILAVALALVTATIVVSAYYSSRVYLYNGEDGGKQVFRVGMELNTFFDILDSETLEENTPLGIPCTDLSAVTENDTSQYTVDNGVYTNNETKLSVREVTDGGETTYEYVYNPDADWGSASNPYIISRINHLQNLYVLQNIGYFETGYYGTDTEKDLPFFLVSQNDGTPVVIDGTGMNFEYIGSEAHPFVGYVGGAFDTTKTVTVNGQTSTQSVIYNLVANCDGTAVDVGLFGHVGYRGDATTAENNEFDGVASTIRDLLLYDVQIKVRDKSGWEALLDKVAHLFSFSDYDDSAADLFPHETHHVGILIGHADYATIEYISVYYSNDDIPAIDVDLTQRSNNGASANFYSVSGIIGYMTALNSTQADGVITIDGKGNDDIVISGGGAGAGGGLESGTGRGYVTAADLYRGFGGESGFAASGKIMKVTKGTGDAQTVDYCLLVERRAETFTYTDPSDNRTQRTTNMCLPDGTPVRYNAADRSYVSTISESKDFLGRTSAEEERWEHYVIYDKTAPSDSLAYYYYANASSDSLQYLTYGTDITESSVSLKYAAQAKEEGDAVTYTRLCTQYERDRVGSMLTGWTQATGRYYFYDGVFTFALSDASDTIDPTWSDGTADTITVGQDNDDDWTNDESGLPDSVVAFLKPVTSASDLAGKQIFIAFKDGDGYHIVTLAKNSNYNKGEQDNAVTTDQTYLSLADDDLLSAIGASLENGTLAFEPAGTATLDTLSADWNAGNIQVLNLGSVSGSAMTLAELKNTYQVRVTQQNVEEDNNTYEDDGVTVVSDTLKNNAKTNTTKTYFPIGSVSKLMTSEDYGSSFLFFTLTGSATVNPADILNVNNTYYEDTGDKITGVATNPLSTRIQIGKAISQQENKIFDGYWHWEKKIENPSFLVFVTYYRYRFVRQTIAADGTVSYSTVYNSDWVESPEPTAFFNNSSTVTAGNKSWTVYTAQGYTGRMYADNTITNYLKEGYLGDTPNGQTGSMKKESEVQSDCLASYTATYHYIVKTTKGNTVSYTFDGTTTACTFGGATGKKTTSIYGYGLYSTDYAYNKDYDLYSCTVGGVTYSQCIMITREAIDGILLQTMTGDGVKFSWMKADLSLSQGAFSIGVDNDGNETGITFIKNVNIGGTDYAICECNGIVGIRIANFDIDGYMTAFTKPGSETTYRLNDTTDLTNAPMLLPGTYPLANGTQTKNYQLYIGGENGNRYLGIKFIKVETDDSQHTYRFWHENPDDANDPYVLDILRRTYVGGTARYGIICATDSYASDTSNFHYTIGGWTLAACRNVNFNHDCTVIFNEDGTAYLQLTVGGETRYLTYDSGLEKFNSGSAQSENAKVYLFALQGTRECSLGDRIVPVAGTEVASYSADRYVLWPDNAYLSTDGSTAAYNPANNYMADTSYSVKSISALGWRNRSGNTLSYSDLDYVFSLGQGISQVNMLELWGGNTGTLLGADNYVKAPIGTTGEEAYIPTGCVAFRINESGSNKIRVIVAVPVSSFCYGSAGNDLDYTKDYSFCMWKVDETPSTTLSTYSFSADNCYAAFELPRSETYDPQGSIADSYYVSGNVKKYINVTMYGKTYRAYLNGDQVLVAYEFDANEEGTYLLGSTKACRIVYFSADATASGGNDGVVTSKKLGTIDFVYDNGDYTVASDGTVTGDAGDKILTVRDIDLEAPEDHSAHYYASLDLLYTDNFAKVTTDADAVNGFPNVNDFLIFVRRVSTHTSNDSTIVWQSRGHDGEGDASYIRFEPYANEETSDALVRKAGDASSDE